MGRSAIPIVNKIVGKDVGVIPENFDNLILVYNKQLDKFFWSPLDFPLAEIFVDGAGLGQNISQNYVKITQFNTVGIVKLMETDLINGTLKTLIASTYAITVQTSITGGNNRVVTVAVFVDDVEQPSVRAQQKLTAGSDVVNISLFGVIAASDNSKIDIRIKQDSGTDIVTLVEGSLFAVAI